MQRRVNLSPPLLFHGHLLRRLQVSPLRICERFSRGLSGIVHLRRRSYGILFLLFRALFFRTYTSVFEKVNKTPLMFTPTTSKIKHVKTNERRGCSNPTTLLS